jgi:membrane peptidoglycan carboxypeptidase
MASKLDLCAIRDTAVDFGVKRSDGGELLYVPATILGTNEVSPLTMAGAYAAIANDGVYCTPIAIEKVIIRTSGEELAVPQSLCSQAVNPEIAAAMTESLRAVMTGGTGVAANTNDGTALAGKTGTTDDRIHTWMAGYSTEVATATWVGNVVGLTPQSGKSVDGLAVSSVRHAVWRDVMLEANKHYENGTFPPANPRFTQSTILRVPLLEGFDAETAKVQLIASELNVQIVEEEVASTMPIGSVAYTLPEFGSEVPRGSIIQVFISGGGKIIVPSVTGLELNDGFSVLEASGLIATYPQPSQLQYLNKCDPNLPADSIHSTFPEAGSEVSDASAIIIIPNRCG